uniref:Pseudouridine synthase n=1 Tax=Serratia symbiotica TaxID=138074 RepID=B4YQR3_9GAMM|nr:pseudouridine synthase [Serratia symbiotica]
MSEKLHKVLARTGYGSRREIEAMINACRVSINGKIAKLGDRIEIHPMMKIRIDGNIISIKKAEETICRVLAYYKPEGELCTISNPSNPEGRLTVFDHLPKLRNLRWVSVGRLDINTSGLLLFTTNGELANRLMHPSRKIEREYAVRVFGKPSAENIKKLKHNIELEDGPAFFRTITFQGGKGLNQWYHVTLTEGRNREVRRLWEAVGIQVSRLIRIRYGNIVLPKGLPRGSWAELDITSINYLCMLVDLKLAKQIQVKNKFSYIHKHQRHHSIKYHNQLTRSDNHSNILDNKFKTPNKHR